MRRVKLTVAYDGTEFFGWQVQPGLPTIQGTLEAVFELIEKRPVHVAGSGRTDAGVHALAQVAAVSMENAIPVDNLRRALNRQLPGSIRITKVEDVHESFHPRFDAISKTYEYRIFRAEVCSPFDRRYVHHHPYPMDPSKFIALAPVFEGERDFTAFAAADDRDALEESKVRTIYSSSAREAGDHLVYTVKGSGLLKHMVRNIVGTLLEGSKGNLDAGDVHRFFEPGSRKATPRAPACGLFLREVEYDFLGRE